MGYYKEDNQLYQLINNTNLQKIQYGCSEMLIHNYINAPYLKPHHNQWIILHQTQCVFTGLTVGGSTPQYLNSHQVKNNPNHTCFCHEGQNWWPLQKLSMCYKF